jgi:hypothetical protein
MRTRLPAVFTVGVLAGLGGALFAAGQGPKAPAQSAATDTPAAELTRTKLLKAKVTAEFTDARLGDILKELAHLAEEQTEEELMWSYGAKFPFAQKVSFTAKGQSLEAALDELFKKAGGGLGYFVVSKPGDKYDGWVKLTTTGERGYETPPASAEDEAAAADRLATAKKLVDGGKNASAKLLLESIGRKFPTTKAAAEAKELLGKLEK